MSEAIRKRVSRKGAYLTALVLLTIAGLVSAIGQQPTTPAHANQVEHFALLVGVNDYAQPSDKAFRVTPLKGPANDVVLIKSALVKYGFKDDRQHVLPLLGKDATHTGIEQAFKTQLIDNASKYPSAIFVFYFSGHGSRAYNVSVGDDSVHDTLVAYDSRSDHGRDILDNELIDLFEALRKRTSNITFILDSCHSGSAIKDVGTMVPRELPPNPTQSGSTRSLSSRDKPSATGGYYLPRRQQFALLSGSLDYESSFENQIQTADGLKYHGYFTYYLVQTLEQEPDISNERAVHDTARALATMSPYQHPLAVGNTEGLVFGGAGERETPYVRMSDPNGDTFKIEAGTPLGIREGTFLAVYAPTARHFVGDKDKIANARVTQVGIQSSIATLSDAPQSALSKDDKVVIVTPFFGFERLRIHSTDLPNQATNAQDRQLLAGVADALKDNTLVALAKNNEDWEIAIRRGCLINDRLIVAADLSTVSPPCTTFVYYLTSKGDEPLMGFRVSANDPGAAPTIAAKITLRAKQENIRGLENAVSPLSGKVGIKLIKVAVQTHDTGKATITAQSDPTNDGPQLLKIGQNFQLQITNNTDPQQNINIYAAVFMLGTSGAIELVTTNPTGDLIAPGKTYLMHAPREVGPPLGRETYKVFASTSPKVDYRVLEEASRGSKGISSPFEWLLSQTTNTKERDSKVNQNVDLSEWTTSSVDVDVRP